MILKEEIKRVDVYFYTGTVTHQLHYREDKLTKNKVVINYARALRPHSIDAKHQYNTAKLIKKSEKSCVFCEYEKKNVPLASKEKRYKKGENVIFQNLYPFEEHHYVSILTKKHFVRSFSPSHFNDLFENYLSLMRDQKTSLYSYINMNYLPPSGASIIHPHAQIFASKNPSPFHKTLISGFRKYSKDAWIKEHKNRDLFIKNGKHFLVFSSFAPRLNKEIVILSKSDDRLSNLNSTALNELSHFVANIVNYFISSNIFQSFNFSLYEHESHGIVMFLGTRSTFHPAYSADRGFMEVYHDRVVISSYPEKIAKEVRNKI
ncbi:MAG: hypothetical protein GXN99_02640 [Candidatus Nanohaloarchaeota archaeon]|nr:hypothetical protein [Candidatus Nanohaloarchaeota archaeon]